MVLCEIDEIPVGRVHCGKLHVEVGPRGKEFIQNVNEKMSREKAWKGSAQQKRKERESYEPFVGGGNAEKLGGVDSSRVGGRGRISGGLVSGSRRR